MKATLLILCSLLITTHVNAKSEITRDEKSAVAVYNQVNGEVDKEGVEIIITGKPAKFLFEAGVAKNGYTEQPVQVPVIGGYYVDVEQTTMIQNQLCMKFPKAKIIKTLFNKKGVPGEPTYKCWFKVGADGSAYYIKGNKFSESSIRD